MSGKTFVSRFGLISIAVLLCASPLAAQTTGVIEGTVSDTSKVPMPGVSIEASSPSLQGSRITVTDAGGRFRLNLLPPGTYSVRARLSSFASIERTGVAVGLDRVVTLEMAMSPAVSEQITVTAEAPNVETASNDMGANLDQKVFQNLPTGRDYASVAQLVGGTSTDAAGSRKGEIAITVYGSTGLENAFLVDGVNTTGVEFGSQGKLLNFEFIQEVEVKTGGYEAEYGHATGGIINVVTKSGGNAFHGDAFAYLDRDSFQAGNKHVGENVEGGVQTGFQRSDFGADLGGYFIKDRLWFFGAYDRVDNSLDTKVTNTLNANLKTNRDLYSGKLTGKLNEQNSIIVTVIGDPETDAGAIVAPIGPASTYEGTNDLGGTDYSLRYEGLLSPKILVTAQVGRHQEGSTITPGSGGNAIRYEDNTGDTVVASGGFGRIDNRDFKRDDYKLDTSLFVGNHNVKIGAEYEKLTASVARSFSGGQAVTILSPLDGDTRTRYQHYYWTTDFATLPDAPSVTFTAEPNHKQVSLFAQDRWTVLPNLTVNVGLRYEQQTIVSKFGVTAFQVDQIAPRLGVSWDPLKSGKTKVYGSYGQFVEAIPMDMNIRSFSAERNPTIYNFDPVSLTPNPDAEAAGSPSTILGGYSEPVDPGLKPQYIDEIVAGAERELGSGIAVGVKGIYRRFGRVIEDGYVAAAGDYFIMNPGEGELGSAYPKARRHFRGLEFTAQKRSGNWQVFASYLLSRLEGNYDGAFHAASGQKDPNINSDFDYPEFLINNDGPLSEDRTHQVKVQGSYTFPFRLTASVSANYRSGAPRTRYGWFDNYGRPELFLTTRGAEGRTPSLFQADLHLGYPIAAGPLTINALIDVFNVFNSQDAIEVDNRYSFSQADNSSPTPTNARYGMGRVFQDPRTLRIGLRASF